MANMIRTAMLLAVMTALFMTAGWFIGGETGMIGAFIIAAGMNLFSWWNSGNMVLRMHGARQVDEKSAPKLVGMVRDLAENANLPMPKVYILETTQPNAFATGRNPGNAAVAASTGLLNHLNDREVAAVMAHELAHVQNRDTLTMTITATLAGAIGMLANFAFFLRGNRDNPFGFIGILIAIIVAPMAAGLVQMAISRTREYEADKDGAEICNDPLALASALEKIAGLSGRIVNKAAEAAPATAHLFIINPLNGERMDNLFSTHPNTENRIAALEALHHEWQGLDRNARRPEVRHKPYDRKQTPAETPSANNGPWGEKSANQTEPSTVDNPWQRKKPQEPRKRERRSWRDSTDRSASSKRGPWE